MYEEGTILRLKEQRPPTIVDGPDVEVPMLDEEGKETGEVSHERSQVEVPFPYNRVRVVGTSFITYTRPPGSDDLTKESYEGQDAIGIIITPETSFAATLDEPYGKLRRLYDIEALPEHIIEQPKVVVRRGPSAIAGPSPEDVFRGDNTVDEAPRSARNPKSPLEDPRPSAEPTSPL